MATLERERILGPLVATLRPLPFVEACAEGGAAAWARIDQWSDIDLNVFIEDGKFDDTFLVVEETLRGPAPDRPYVRGGRAAEGGM